jgi:Icc-related predicted phosphoesterase
MKVLCVADQIDPLVYSNSIKARFRDVELVLSAGDLPMEYLGFIASSLNKPIVFVFGNHHLSSMKVFRKDRSSIITGLPNDDESSLPPNTYGATYVGGKSLKIKGLLIAGLGGSMWYNGGPNQYTDFQMFWKVMKLVPRMLFNRLVHGRYLDIFLTHSPPLGIGDKEDRCHTGFKAFRWFLRRFRPRYMIHGHIHLYDLNAQRKNLYHETQILNVYNHLVLEIEKPR